MFVGCRSCYCPVWAAFILLTMVVSIRTATHDELPQCGLSGVFKTRQSVIESPNYPNKYPPNTCWDYVVRSPYRCPTKFHIQFLDFFLETSPNCTNDYLAIGLQNDGDDMDILCGQVIGIKKYHTPDGILRLRFLSDDSPWTTGRGFKLLVTRLACEREDLLYDNLDHTDEDTVQVNAPTLDFQPPHAALPPIFRNLTASEQYKPYQTPPLFGWNLPQQFPVPPPPSFGSFYQPQAVPTSGTQTPTTEKPCVNTKSAHNQQSPPYYNPNWSLRSQQTPLSRDQYVGSFQIQQAQQQQQTPGQTLLKSNADTTNTQTRQEIDPPFGVTPTLEHCCTSSFHQKRFYLSSPGFPRTAFTSLLPTQQRDCQFNLEKSAHNICRLRIEFKFFDFGQAYVGTGDVSGNVNVANTRDICTEDFLEINGERFCGCRTGFVYTTLWGLGGQSMRMRMGYSGIPSSGFLLEIFQEECRETAFVQPQLPAPANNQNNFGNNLGVQQAGVVAPAGNQQPVQYPMQQTIFGQPQLPIYTQQAFYPTLPANVQQQQQQQRQQLQQQQQLHLPPQQFWAPPPPPPPPQFGLMPQFRQARALENVLQPISVVETNSTRKEYYYFDGDEALARARPIDEPDDPDRMDAPLTATVRDRCSFSTMDALRLTVDPLWITKPTCYAPFRSWFSNMFG